MPKLSERLKRNRHLLNQPIGDCLIELAQLVEAIDQREQDENRYLRKRIGELSARVEPLVDRELVRAALAACQVQSPFDARDLSTALENARQLLEQALGE